MKQAPQDCRRIAQLLIGKFDSAAMTEIESISMQVTASDSPLIDFDAVAWDRLLDLVKEVMADNRFDRDDIPVIVEYVIEIFDEHYGNINFFGSRLVRPIIRQGLQTLLTEALEKWLPESGEGTPGISI